MTARRSIGTDRRCGAREHQELRLLLPVSGAAPEADDPDLDAHPRQERRGVRRPGTPLRRRIHLRPERVGIKVLTEFYDPVVLDVGESIYLDSNMGHAYVTAEGCDEAMVLGVCSSTDEGLMHSLMSLHGEAEAPAPAPAAPEPIRAPVKAAKNRKR